MSFTVTHYEVCQIMSLSEYSTVEVVFQTVTQNFPNSLTIGSVSVSVLGWDVTIYSNNTATAVKGSIALTRDSNGTWHD